MNSYTSTEKHFNPLQLIYLSLGFSHQPGVGESIIQRLKYGTVSFVGAFSLWRYLHVYNVSKLNEIGGFVVLDDGISIY
jgi:hypothetical protein